MAKAPSISTKRIAISKANTQAVAIVAAASFVTVFCLVAASAVWSQTRYQAKVVSAKEKAHRQLQDNTDAYTGLANAYKKFDGKDPNIIGGKKDGTGDKDGRNAKIILDALPSSYDFPALTSSLEKMLTDRQLKISSITGTDDQLNEGSKSQSPTPEPVEMPFSFTVSNANYNGVQELVKALQKSIRPIQVDSVTITGGASNMTVTINAHTYYQPGRSLDITKEVVK